MDSTIYNDGDGNPQHPGMLAFDPGPASAPKKPSKAKARQALDIEEDREDEEKDDEDGEQGSADGGGGGVVFEETEHDFDDAELQGLSLPIFRRALKKGLQLASRVTKTVERDLRNFLPGGLHTRVVELAFSKKGHPTLLLDKGEIVQYQMSTKGKLERVRVTPDLEAERAVKYAMAGFVAAGESIDPKHVKFGRTPEFEARMKPIWTREYNRIQEQENAARMDMRLKDVRFAVGTDQRPKPVVKVPAWIARQPKVERPFVDMPRGSTHGAHGPGL